MKQVSTLFLKIAVMLIGIPILALCIFSLPWLANNPVNPDYAHILYPVLIIMYVSVLPFFIALYQAFRLLIYIDKSKAFSELSVRALKNIKYCAITISVLYAVGMPFFYFIAEIDDAPGIILIGLVVIFASMVIAVFAAVLQKLLKEAIDIKSENDLTV
ncbi:DUF2975 domain-containing protein [Bacillus cereus]|uniref:DUF2975 domain-containing protein n=1 Tax=Bacillus TaxID=1386 RepID=UPI000478CA1C|nr:MULTISPECIES: DUF2975 domain-containing protein [Bacillus]PFE05100.1 DUF2975 domain-containing protein [Bacillus sp. AFS023182]PGY03025.1 DUF2975 domain-containing protein [Bacillus cereus]WIY62291.1 DUF2975 domain-containing protein [Bacillus arachidis]SDZ26816.1 Protein of unknown function [Bacillus sp. 166amftsu]